MKLYQKKFINLFKTENLKYAFRNKIISKNIRGLDGIDNNKFRAHLDKELDTISRKVINGNYKFTPYLEKLIVKRKYSNPRQIAIPSKRDQLVLYQLKEFLKYCYQDDINSKLPNEYILQILTFMQKNNKVLNNFIFIKSDIIGFYDNINRETLMNKLRKNINESTDKHILKLLFRSITNYIVPKSYHKRDNHKYLNASGIPQGLAISNLLADIYMMKFDCILEKESLLYLRYVDDFLIFINKKDLPRILNILNKKLKKLALELNPDKTIINECSESFEYLGYSIKGSITSVRKSSIESQISKIAHHFKHNLPDSQNKINEKKEVFIEDLNEIITGAISDKKRYGWLFYYSRINDMHILFELDRIVEKFFKRTALFNHQVPNKRKRYVTAYFRMKRNDVKQDNYFHNYGYYSNKEKKIEFLKYRISMEVEELLKLNAKEIDDMFIKLKENRLRNLEKDVHRNRS